MAERKANILTRRPLTAFFALSILLFLPLFVAAGGAFTLEAPAWLQYLTQALSSWSPKIAAVIATGAIFVHTTLESVRTSTGCAPTRLAG